MTPGDLSSGDPPSGDPPGKQVRLAVIDLAQRLGVASDAVTLLRQDEVTWPDTSIGCPQPGMAYQQMLTPGLRIVLECQGRRFEYHSGGRRDPFLCSDPRPHR